MTRLLASLVLVLTLSGCSTMDAVKAVTGIVSPDKPEITAQIGAENTKQGIGVTSRVTTEEKTETTIGDIKGPNANVKQKTVTTRKTQQMEAANVSATNMKIVNSDPTSLLWAFAIGMSAVLGLVFWFVPTPRQLFRSKEQ